MEGHRFLISGVLGCRARPIIRGGRCKLEVQTKKAGGGLFMSSVPLQSAVLFLLLDAKLS